MKKVRHLSFRFLSDEMVVGKVSQVSYFQRVAWWKQHVKMTSEKQRKRNVDWMLARQFDFWARAPHLIWIIIRWPTKPLNRSVEIIYEPWCDGAIQCSHHTICPQWRTKSVGPPRQSQRFSKFGAQGLITDQLSDGDLVTLEKRRLTKCRKTKLRLATEKRQSGLSALNWALECRFHVSGSRRMYLCSELVTTAEFALMQIISFKVKRGFDLLDRTSRRIPCYQITSSQA